MALNLKFFPSIGNNVLKIALPTSSANRIQKAQRIILPSEAIKVIDTSGGTRLTPQIQPKKVFSSQLRKTRPKGLVFSQSVTKNFILTSKLDYPSLAAKFSHSFHS